MRTRTVLHVSFVNCPHGAVEQFDKKLKNSPIQARFRTMLAHNKQAYINRCNRRVCEIEVLDLAHMDLLEQLVKEEECKVVNKTYVDIFDNPVSVEQLELVAAD